jgi:uncharacterized protein (TIGR02594 family)
VAIQEKVKTMNLPKNYQWLNDEDGPRILKEMVSLYGTIEVPGEKNNPLILKWANEIGLGHIYKADSIAWCGLCVAYAAAQAGWDHAPRGNALWARNWLAWGTAVPSGKQMLGDVLVFSRGSSGHVGIYCGEDETAFHVIGGNQGDAVSIKRIPKARLLSGRRCPWRVNQPASVRKIFMAANGPVSTNEA